MSAETLNAALRLMSVHTYFTTYIIITIMKAIKLLQYSVLSRSLIS